MNTALNFAVSQPQHDRIVVRVHGSVKQRTAGVQHLYIHFVEPEMHTRLRAQPLPALPRYCTCHGLQLSLGQAAAVRIEHEPRLDHAGHGSRTANVIQVRVGEYERLQLAGAVAEQEGHHPLAPAL